MNAHHCKKCGKEFYPTYYWTYKKNGFYYCSWKCFNHRNDDKPKREIIRPKVGDTIRIIKMSYIKGYVGRVGVVKKIDFLGQLHGTWGGLVVIPEQDVIEIVEEQTDD